MRRLRVLVSAFACNPYRLGEYFVGWSVVLEMARYHDVWVITNSANKKNIEETLSKQKIPGLHFEYLSLPPFLNFWGRWLFFYYLNYFFWQIGAYFLARRLHKNSRFDVTHQLTFTTGFIPGFLYLLPVPFVWGPINTGTSFPFCFMKYFSLRGKMDELLRRMAQSSMRYNVFSLSALKHAKAVLAFTNDKGYFSGKRDAQKIRPFPLGLTDSELNRLARAPFRDKKPFIILSVGRLYYFKGFSFGICAFARFLKKYPESEYWIMGEGSEKAKLLSLVNSLAIAKKVRFLGHMSGEQKYSMLSNCDVFMFPSLREGMSAACLEAMASGKPILCLDKGGSSFLVNKKTGIKCKVDNPEQVIEDLTRGLLLLHDDVPLRKIMGEEARARIKALFNWDVSGNLLSGIYQETVSQAL